MSAYTKELEANAGNEALSYEDELNNYLMLAFPRSEWTKRRRALDNTRAELPTTGGVRADPEMRSAFEEAFQISWAEGSAQNQLVFALGYAVGKAVREKALTF
jgi:hypothetical protein